MKRLARMGWIAVWGCALGVLGYSQDKTVLTLDECLRLALEQNPFVLATREKEAAAKAQVRQATARFFPSLNGEGTDILAEKVFILEFPSLIPGEPPQKIKMDFTKTYQFSLGFSMPLYAGGSLVSSHKQAGYNLQAAGEAIRQSRQETVFSVKKAFYGYLLAQKFSEVAAEAVALAEKHHTNVKNLHDVGMVSRFDLLRSEVQVANLKPQFIRARNSLAVAELGLKTLLGIDLAQPVEIKGELNFTPTATDVEEAVRRALLKRPEINQLKYQRMMAGEMVKIARASGLPSLAIGGAYNFWANRLNLRKKNWESFYQVNLVLRVPIFNGFSVDAQVGQSKAVLRELELTQKGLAEAIGFEVRQAILNYHQAEESLASQGKNVEQAQEAVRIAELNYSEGLATSLDVSTAQVALSEAKTNYAQALYDCVVSLADLERAVGESPNDYQPK